MDSIEITPCGPVRGSIRPPGSKSITNRALVCAALADGVSTLTGALVSDDTEVMIESLGRMGIAVEEQAGGRTLIVRGCGGRIPRDSADLFVENSGTTIRFLTALAALGNGRFRLDGIPRMRERPIGDLARALRQLGATVECESPGECPPVSILANGLPGGQVEIRGDISSQYLSGLLMAAPAAKGEVVINVEGELVSQPYIEMTLATMRAFGVSVDDTNLRRFVVAPQRYQACKFAIEPDASAASYFWGVAAVTGGTLNVEGLSPKAWQGDVAFCDVLQQMGCQINVGEQGMAVQGGQLKGIEVDMNDISDTVQTLAVVALFADGPTTIRGVAHIRHKETDRIGDLARELRKLGAGVEELPDGLVIQPGQPMPAEIETYNDHRMAMSFALAGLKIPGVVISDPGCTAKTYPDFFADLGRLCDQSAARKKSRD